MNRKKTGEKRRKTCRECGRPPRDDEQISRSGLCADCATARMVELQAALRLKRGAAYDRWVLGMQQRRRHPMRVSPDPDRQAG